MEVINIEEIWKDIEGYEGFYKVSNMGRVKGLDRSVNVTSYPLGKKRVHKKKVKGIVLKERYKNGYVMASLCKGGIRKTFLVHRIVAMSFIQNDDNKPEVNHIDGNKKNNNVDNLEWVTREENMKHAIGCDSINIARGENANTAKLTKEEVIEIKKKLRDGNMLQCEIAKEYNISDSVISSIKRLQYWSHIKI